MNTFMIFILILNSALSISIKELTSTTLDFIPIIGNLKSVTEAYSGEDLITGEKLSVIERTLSLLGGIPGVNYFKSGKHLKNGKKFLKAAQRAQKLGKMKNFKNFSKASARAFSKVNKIQNFIKNTVKATKVVFTRIIN